MKVFYPEGYDPRPLFVDEETDNIIEYVPVDKYGSVMIDVSMKKGETLHIVGKKALRAAGIEGK